ncbi:MAG: YtxH domain-containing protein [Vampirovibrionales bacterium]|nr:YtxH domain-containing protein [Vampirovibrionales bacterium]
MSKGKYVAGALIGGALGALIGLLLAPRSGIETREMIKESLGNVNDCCQETKSKVQHELHDKSELLKAKASSISDRVKSLSEEIESRGREAFQKLAGEKVAVHKNGGQPGETSETEE